MQVSYNTFFPLKITKLSKQAREVSHVSFSYSACRSKEPQKKLCAKCPSVYTVVYRYLKQTLIVFFTK
jgi:hypothetical protein